MHWTYDSNNARAYFNTNQQVTLTFSNGSTHSYTYGKDFQTIADLCCLANKDLSDANINDILTFSSDGKIIESDGNGITNVSVQDSNGNTVTDTTTGLGAMGKILDGLDGTNSQTNIIQKNDI